MEFNSIKTVKSERYPDVSFEIRVMTEGVRTRLNINLSDALETLRDYQNELQAIELPRLPDGRVDNDAPLAVDVATKVSIIVDKINLLRRSKLDPVYLQECFVSVSGLSINGRSDGLTFKDLRENGPLSLTREIVAIIRDECETSEEEGSNLGSPITSAAAADGLTSDTAADIVANGDSTSIGIAVSTSPKT